MKLKVIVTLAATSLGAAALLAQPEPAQGKAAPPAAAAAGKLGALMPKTVPLPPPEGLKWGLSLSQLSKLRDKEIEKAFKPRFLAVGNSPEVLAIEAELKSKQGLLLRNKMAFDETPTDIAELKGEYTRGNGESIARMPGKAKGTMRNFFFFKDELWKVYDEHPLGPDSALGQNFAEAVVKLTAKFGVAPQKIAADYDKGRNFDEAVWRDDNKVIRAIDRSNILGMVYADKKVQDNLATYRTKTRVNDEKVLDKDVAAATANPPTQISTPQGKKEKDPKAK